MHCNEARFQHCFDNNLGNNFENNVWNLEHNVEKLATENSK